MSWSQMRISSCSLLAEVVVEPAGGEAHRLGQLLHGRLVVAAARRRRAPPRRTTRCGGGRSARAARVVSEAVRRCSSSNVSFEFRSVVRYSLRACCSISDEATQLLQRTVREFAVGEVAPVAEELDRTKAFPYELVAQMGELGWMGIPFPEEVRRRRAAARCSTRSRSRSSRGSTRSSRSRCARTPRSARSRSTSSATTSRRRDCCPTCAPGASSARSG